jgi:hypothetical protein
MDFQKILQKSVNKDTSTKEPKAKVEDLFVSSSSSKGDKSSDLNINEY